MKNKSHNHQKRDRKSYKFKECEKEMIGGVLGLIVGAPGKAGNFLLVKVRHRQRIATSLSPKVHLRR